MQLESDFIIEHQLQLMFTEVHHQVRYKIGDSLTDKKDFIIRIIGPVHKYSRNPNYDTYKIAREMCFIITKLYGLSPRLHLNEFCEVYEETPLVMRISGCVKGDRYKILKNIPSYRIWEHLINFKRDEWVGVIKNKSN